MEFANIAIVFAAFAAGGLLKGAVGAGAPLLAVPVMAITRDIQFAVAVFVLPNIVPNLWQYLQHRRRITAIRFAWIFALMGGLGAGIGTFALADWNPKVLMVGVGVVLSVYILFRLFNPAWTLALATASRFSIPIGLAAGMFQGATGLSAPISISFLSALRLEREDFIATISLFFIALGIGQLPAQLGLGIMTPTRLTYSALALIPLMGFMPIGAWLGRRIPRVVFEKIILGVLGILAVRLIWGGVA